MILKTKMYKHQIDAADKLIRIKVGALYMEQGTGKTRVALELIKRRLDKDKINKVLWLCPCSVKSDLKLNIMQHSEGWEDLIKIAGIESLSGSIRVFNECDDYVDEKTFLIIDESNLVKNHKTYRTERIQHYSEKCKYKIILNGTPISKNEADLYSQWKILDWRILGFKSFYSFANRHIVYDLNNPQRIKKIINRDQIFNKIAPYVYQIKKSECLDIPPKHYYEYSATMSDEQSEEYHKVGRELFLDLEETKPETIYRLFTGLQNVLSGKYVNCKGKRLLTAPMFKDPKDNPRIQKVLRLIEDIEGKIIIYCKYVSEIEDLNKLIPSSVVFYGKTSFNQRKEAIEQFRNDKRILIANKACAGYGLNLQFANNIIYYSNDWDFATRAQSEDRVHRIGQDKDVNIYDIVVPGTIDRKILDCLNRKELLIDYFKNHIEEIRNELGIIESGISEKQAKISKEVLSDNGDTKCI